MKRRKYKKVVNSPHLHQSMRRWKPPVSRAQGGNGGAVFTILRHYWSFDP
ncbi:MAG: hypothetical protein HKN60_05630 [Rhizobiales bacterium]|nr:hypothetical protein [Hyphomicrobiales bacterium]